MEAIGRKGLGGLCGPDSPEGEVDYPLHDSPRNDSSNQNDNDYQALVQNRNQINAGGTADFSQLYRQNSSNSNQVVAKA